MNTKEFHPAAMMFPMMTSDEAQSLQADIALHGQLEPIRLYRGDILDGRNRYLACQALGLTPRYTELSDDLNPWDYVWSENAERRHLSAGQKAIIKVRQLRASTDWQAERDAAKQQADTKRSQSQKGVSKQKKKERVSSQDKRRSEDNWEHVQVANAAGVGTATASRAMAVDEKRPDLADQVQAGEMSLTEAVRQVRRDEVQANLPTLPTDEYRVFYADPPWSYRDTREGVEQYGPAARHYPSMSIAELCALNIRDLTAENAVLFLWVPAPLLEDAFLVVKAWGFQFKTFFVWDKVKHNYGHYSSVRHEVLLLCTRGSCLPDIPKLFDSVQSIARSKKHSEKPQTFREIIDTLYPHGKRLELFARHAAPGWETYGTD